MLLPNLRPLNYDTRKQVRPMIWVALIAPVALAVTQLIVANLCQ